MNLTIAIYPERVGQSYNQRIKIQNLNNLRLSEHRQKAVSDLQIAKKANKSLKKSYNSSCITGVSVGHCSNNHMFYKPVYCEKEDCTFCGQDKSPAHQRRISSVIDQIQSWSAVSYFVITVPEEGRGYLQSKENLNKFRNFVRRKFKRDGFTTGLLRWHWAGDCRICHNKKGIKETCQDCQGTGCGNTFEPHLNILFPAGNTVKKTKKGKEREAVTCYDHGKHTVKAEYLQLWRDSVKQWFKDHFKVESEGNIYHSFIAPGDKAKKMKIFHKVRYILRATLRNVNLSQYVRPLLKGYKNTSKIGIWEKPINDHVKMCPCCGEKLEWYGEPSHVFFSLNKKLIEVEPGLFYVHFTDS